MPHLLVTLVFNLAAAPPAFAEAGEPFVTTAPAVVTESAAPRSSVVIVVPEGTEVRASPTPGRLVPVTLVGEHDELIEGYVLASLLRPRSAAAHQGPASPAQTTERPPCSALDAPRPARASALLKDKDPHDLGPLIARVASLDAQRARPAKP